MPGDPASRTLAQTKVQNKKAKLEEYETKLGLYNLPANKDECSALSLTGEEISKLSPEDRDNYAADLAAYSIYIQRTLSKEKALLRWLDNQITLTIAPTLQSYQGYYSHDQRRAVAIINDEYASELEELRMNSQLKVDLLEGLTFQINQMCRVLMTKRV